MRRDYTEGDAMSDIPNDFRPLDPGRINPMDPIELSYWARELGCSEARLAQVVAKVGEHIAAVRAELEANP